MTLKNINMIHAWYFRTKNLISGAGAVAHWVITATVMTADGERAVAIEVEYDPATDIISARAYPEDIDISAIPADDLQNAAHRQMQRQMREQMRRR